MWKYRFFPLLVALLLVAPVGAQGGRGVIRQGTLTPIAELSTLNPLLCSNDLCRRASDMLFPALLNVDPFTELYTPAGGDDNAVVADWTIGDDSTTYTFTVRDDLTWSDGTPISAVDVLFTLAAVFDRNLDSTYYRPAFEDDIVALSATDAQTVTVEFASPTCQGLHLLDVPVIPAHPFNPDFTVDYTYNPDDSFRYVRSHPFDLAPVTAGDYVLEEIRAPEFMRLTTADGTQGYEFVPVADFSALTEAFLEGETNVLLDYPPAELPNLTGTNAQVWEDADTVVYMLALNLANPNTPRSWNTVAEDGQGIHPVFGDVRVRQAVQIGVNVDEIIAVALGGRATPVNRMPLPRAWFNAGVTPPGYNYDAARQLLNEAGWRDTDGNGTRECRACTTAPVGTPLAINLQDPTASVQSSAVATLVARQLERLGFSVSITSGSPSEQQFDVALERVRLDNPVNASVVFSALETAQDIPGRGRNVTSYSNADVDALLQAANTERCMDVDARSAVYAEVQSIVTDEVPYVPLLAPHTLFVVDGGIRNFQQDAPDPLLNINEWVVTDVRLMP